ncbi:hypothetical protein Ddye_025929 [Dipteronia dyeriana]|uniref:Reverse transcriptase zinc-binding domain-containing protein n=1 Tax=Dipteronia dyeriana TaxID=168575 RepID=A0AAD9TM45_9ROSI|nr:hypothetical protein Ddye_025929 [Dipteronia dyeriana]
MISVYKDHWLPRPSTFRPFSLPTLSINAKVCDLKLPSGVWTEELIRSSFFLEDVELVLSIPCSLHDQSDTLMWHFDKLGSYSMKSGYHLGCNLMNIQSSSGLALSESWWKFLWRIRIPTKIKLFIWRACFDWIPTHFNLAKRRMEWRLIVRSVVSLWRPLRMPYGIALLLS